MTSSKALKRDPIEEARQQWIAHGWGNASDGMAAVTSVMRVQQILMRRIDSLLRPLELSFARYEVLTLLSFTSTGSLPMTKMGALLQVHPTSVTSAVDRLEAQGFVERLAHPADRRAVLAVITDHGRTRVAKATKVLNDEVFENFGISQTQTAQLTRILRSFRVNAGDFAPLTDN